MSPPGDIRKKASTGWDGTCSSLEKHVARRMRMTSKYWYNANLVMSLGESGRPGRHLIINGHTFRSGDAKQNDERLFPLEVMKDIFIE